MTVKANTVGVQGYSLLALPTVKARAGSKMTSETTSLIKPRKLVTQMTITLGLWQIGVLILLTLIATEILRRLVILIGMVVLRRWSERSLSQIAASIQSLQSGSSREHPNPIGTESDWLGNDDEDDGLVRLHAWRDESGSLRTAYGTVYEDSQGRNPVLGDVSSYGREAGSESYGSTGIQPGGTSFEEADVDAQRALTRAVRQAQKPRRTSRFRRKRRATKH